MRFIFLFLVSVLSLPANATEYLGEWTCIAQDIRANEATVDSRMILELRKEGDTVKATKIAGHVIVGNFGETIPSFQYYSLFSLKDIVQNTKYKPRVYKNHIQFKDIDSLVSNATDGGGMWGELVVHQSVLEKSDTTTAHYIFQSGDHLGGTIDYKCTK